ncbi:hypothetical protein A9Q96_00555 [Rhodobacterales bacterium 52_120_T64]|nr:hypothetical protein A9Q96_00555 [Rhodobacterales bacterium 52_120_T64]
MPRAVLSDHLLEENIREQVSGYHAETVNEVQKAIIENRVVVVGMRYNDAVYSARKALKKAGIEFTYLEYGSYTSSWRKRLALKMWTGWPTFPMVFVDKALVGGSKDVRALIADGRLNK